MITTMALKVLLSLLVVLVLPRSVSDDGNIDEYQMSMHSQVRTDTEVAQVARCERARNDWIGLRRDGWYGLVPLFAPCRFQGERYRFQRMDTPVLEAADPVAWLPGGGRRDRDNEDATHALNQVALRTMTGSELVDRLRQNRQAIEATGLDASARPPTGVLAGRCQLAPYSAAV